MATRSSPGTASRATRIAGSVDANPFSTLGVDSRLLGERIYEAVKEKILRQELAPGSTLPIRAIAEGLGVSVTPVRDALRRLSLEGLVHMRGRSQTVVASLRPDDITEIFDVRLAIEVHAGRRGIARVSDADLASLDGLIERTSRMISNDVFLDYGTFIQIDQQFHHFLVGLAANQRLLAIYESLSIHMQIARVYYNNNGQYRAAGTHSEHLAILDAYHRRDPVAAAAAIERHLENTRRDICDRLN